MIAEHFVRAGASVLLTAHDITLLEETRESLLPLATFGQKVLIEQCDVSNTQSCDAVVGRAMRDLPGVNILVNNAGVYGPKGAIEEVDWDEWIRALRSISSAPSICAGRSSPR